MKGTIVKCLEELVRKNYGADSWKAILTDAGQGNKMFLASMDVPDADAVALIGSTAKVLNISQNDAFEAFGNYWSTVYAPSLYPAYFAKAKGARDFLLNMHGVHETVTRTVKDARPPHFTYDDSDPKKLVMNYSSSRNLVALMPGLVRGVAAYYKERVDVRLVGNALHISFLG